MEGPELWRELGQQLRVDSIRAAAVTNSGHPTSSMSAADLMAVLLAKYLRYDFDEPDNPANDHLIFSKGHASPLLYSLYKAAGAITDEELLTFRVFGSRLQGHPTPAIPWVDVATGSLGQGLPFAVGIGARRQEARPACPYRIWCLCGDSEMAEGSMWEAFEHAAFYGLDNLTAIIDVNQLGQRGETMHGWDLDSYANRAKAFGWHAIEIDGHDVEAIDEALGEAAAQQGQPTVIVAHTLKGKGVKEVEDKPGWHGKALDHPDEAIAELGGERNIVVDVPKPEAGRAASLRGRRRASCRPGSWARRWRRGGPTATRSRRWARSAATWSRSTARSRTRPTPRSSARRTPTGTSRCTSPSSRWSRRRSACRCGTGCRSPRPSPRSCRAPTTSSAWPRSARRTSASAARTPASRSARTGRRRWRSRTSP